MIEEHTNELIQQGKFTQLLLYLIENDRQAAESIQLCKDELKNEGKQDELLLILKEKDLELYFDELRGLDKLKDVLKFLPYFRSKYD